MKSISCAVLAFCLSLPLASSVSALNFAVITTNQEVAHGGGCRKSSPAGQCCHMQTSVGRVHCH